jgi:hypothetical protein
MAENADREGRDNSQPDAAPPGTGRTEGQARDISSTSANEGQEAREEDWVVPAPRPEEYAGPLGSPGSLRGDYLVGHQGRSAASTLGDTARAKHDKPKSLSARKRDQFLWLWPVVVLLLMVLASIIWGALGTFITAAIAVGTLALFIGDIVLGTVIRVFVAAIAVLLAAGALIAHEENYSFFSSKPSQVTAATSKTKTGGHVIDLRGKRVTLAELKGRNLHGALLAGADLSGLDLYGMNLNGIVAPGASFRRAILDRASLIGANLRGADLSEACLHGTILTGAQLEGVDAAHADVTNAKVEPAVTRKAATWPRRNNGTVVANCG